MQRGRRICLAVVISWFDIDQECGNAFMACCLWDEKSYSYCLLTPPMITHEQHCISLRFEFWEGKFERLSYLCSWLCFNVLITA